MIGYNVKKYTTSVVIPANDDTHEAPVVGASSGSDELCGILKGITISAPDLTGTSCTITITGQRGESLFSKALVLENAVSHINVDANNHPLQVPVVIKAASPLKIKSVGTPNATGTLTFDNAGAIADGGTVSIGGQVYRAKTALAQVNDFLIEADVAATAILTWANGGVNVSNGKKVVAGAKEYTFKTALSEAYATALLSSNNTDVADGATVTLGDVTYRIVDTMTQINDVQRDGTTADTTLQHLIDAVNHTGTEGTDYYTGTVANPLVSAGTIVSHEVTFTAKELGVAGNSIAKAETSANLSWDVGGGGTTFSGGVAAVANEVLIGSDGDDSLVNLKKAINGEAGIGTKYSTGTTANADLTSSEVAAHALTMTANVVGPDGNALAKSTDEATLDWDGTGAVFTGGAWSGDSTLANLVVAINKGAGGGVKYHNDTVANAYVTAAAVGSHATVVTAVEGVEKGSDVATTETCTHLSWGAATLTGGGEASARTFAVDLFLQVA